MGNFNDAVTAAMAVWFGTDMDPETVAYNGTNIPGHIHDSGTEADADSTYDFLDIEVRASDVSVVTYRTDTLARDGLTWRYPRIVKTDGHTLLLRWIRNQRPKAR